MTRSMKTSAAGSDNVTREEIHMRRIEMKGFLRSDGLYEVEGRVLDCKPFEFVPTSGGNPVAAGDPIHSMGVRLAFDERMVIRAVQTCTDAAPYGVCWEGGRVLQELVGLKIGPGWGSQIRRMFGGGKSCTHLMELLMPLATTAIQSLGTLHGRSEETNAEGKPIKIDSCYAYSSSGELVMRRWPKFYKPE